MEQLQSETDFFNFLKLLRMTDFISKLYLKEMRTSMPGKEMPDLWSANRTWDRTEP